MKGSIVLPIKVSTDEEVEPLTVPNKPNASFNDTKPPSVPHEDATPAAPSFDNEMSA